VPKRELSNAIKAMGVRAGQRLELDDEPAAAPVSLVTEPEAAASPREPEPEPANLSMVEEFPAALPAELKRRGKKSREQAQQVANAKHMGTIETPYVRQRDNTPTRKVSVILPVDLALELQLFCVRTGQRTNTFHEEALRAALARATSRAGR
jgi:hypothetical protein